MGIDHQRHKILRRCDEFGLRGFLKNLAFRHTAIYIQPYDMESKMSLTSPITDTPGLSAYDADRVAAVAVKAYARIAEAWALKNETAAELVGASERTWARMKKPGWAGRLSKDQMLRVSALSGLYKALHLYFSDALADTWISLENAGPYFGGRPPLDIMLRGGLPAIMDTRDYVDALRGGV